MPKKSKTADAGAHPNSPTLSLLVKPAEQRQHNVNAEHFFAVAERWLKALQAFATDTGRSVTWEIVELKKSSAFVQVRPVEPQTFKPIPDLTRKWEVSLRAIDRTGHAPQEFSVNSLSALQEFVRSVPSDSIVSVGNGRMKKPFTVTATTQRRVEEAVAALASTVPAEYSVRGTLRGRLAILNSWNPAERYFRLQIPLAPAKPVHCTYRDERLVSELGAGFEGVIEVGGLLHYRREEIWPHRAEVDTIRVLHAEGVRSLKDLVGLLHLPNGQDSVSYLRSVRDAE